MLKIDGLHTYYGSVHALKGISIHVEEGEVVSLIGANGAGKTTLLKTISGLIRPARGEILFRAENIGRLPAHEVVMRGVIQVPEGRRIFPEFSVGENLRVAGFFKRRRPEYQANLRRVQEMFPILKEREEQLGSTLSGGQQQMLAIGRALMASPQLLLLDEPSLGLSPTLIDHVFETLAGFKKQGLTMLLVEQNAKKALRLSDRAYVLETGTLVLEGDSRSIVDDPRVKEAYLGIASGGAQTMSKS
jgi:branched-chain amino acid transport system ATP-binding protein